MYLNWLFFEVLATLSEIGLYRYFEQLSRVNFIIELSDNNYNISQKNDHVDLSDAV